MQRYQDFVAKTLGTGLVGGYALEALDKMAQIIKDDPSITVRDLAREMGFLETRSIYYWLDKGKYDGLKQFKRAVLSHRESSKIRAERVAEDAPESFPRDEQGALMKVPVARAVSSDGSPIWSDQYIRVVLPSGVSQSTFAILASTAGSASLLPGQTWLVIDPAMTVRDRTQVLLLRRGGDIVVARAMCFGSACRYTLSSGDEVDQETVVVGVVRARLEFMAL